MPLVKDPTQEYEASIERVTFRMYNQGELVLCIVSREALDDFAARQDISDNPEQVFVKFRALVEELASRKFFGGGRAPDGNVIITTADWPSWADKLLDS